MSEPRAKAVGKLVYLDDQELAYCDTQESAWVIAWCLNNARGGASRRVQEFFA